MIDLDAIERRDERRTADGYNFRECDDDRRALLAYVRELIAAARKVECHKCTGDGLMILNLGQYFTDPVPCPSCSALRALLPEVKS